MKLDVNTIFNGMVGITAVIVAIFAVFEYFRKSRSEVKTASIAVCAQINRIEDNISILKKLSEDGKLSNIDVYSSNKILGKNEWNENKKYLISRLKPYETEIIDSYFSLAEKVDKAKEDFDKCLLHVWYNKDAIYQNEVMKFSKDITNQMMENESIIPPFSKNQMDIMAQQLNQKMLEYSLFNFYDGIFEPRIIQQNIIVSLNSFNTIKGTTAYARLIKLSK